MATANLPLRAARFYARSGLSVLAWRYTDGAKRPAHAWKTMQDWAQTVDDVTAWWRAHPDDNVGIVTGAISNLVIVDCDDDVEAVEDTLKDVVTDAEGQRLTDALEVPLSDKDGDGDAVVESVGDAE